MGYKNSQKGNAEKVITVLGQERGSKAEMRVISAIISHVNQKRKLNRKAYPWLSLVRKPLQIEERAKVDIVLITDSGTIGVQIKTSLRGIVEHEQASTDVPAFLVDGTTTDEQIAVKILQKVYEIRKKGRNYIARMGKEE